MADAALRPALKNAPATYTPTANDSYILRKTDGRSIEYKRYQYKRLSTSRSIRLLTRIRTHPGDSSFDHFSIEERCLDDESFNDDSNKYIPISYVWGEDNAPTIAPLILGNEVDGSVCLITKSAWEAIEAICVFGRLIWIDQVCINQKDKKERRAQVELMGAIYGGPGRFVSVVWLGAADEETKVAFDLIEGLSKVMPTSMDIPISANDSFHMPHDMIRRKIQQKYPAYTPPPDDDPSWTSLAKILARKWYMRMWTFQEVVLTEVDSVSVVSAWKHGRYMTTLRKLMRASILLGDHPILEYNNSVTENRESLHLINGIQHRLLNKLPIPLHLLLQVTHRRGCRDPLDKVYALLNVQRNDLAMDRIEVDYTKSYSEVYADTTRKIVASEMSLLVSLSASGRHEGQAGQLPSWVPDYSGTILASYLEALNPNSPVFSASYGRRWKPPPVQSALPLTWQQLPAQGGQIDIITNIDDHVMPAKASNNDINAYLEQILPNILLQSAESSSENDIEKMILRIARTVIVGGYNTYLFGFRSFSFILNAAHHSYAANAALNDGRAYGDQDLVMLRRMFSQPPPSHAMVRIDGSKERDWRHDFCKQAALCKGRRLAILEKYGVGLVPQQTKVEDIVAILHGSSLPVILRSIPGGTCFQLIGPCFVDGIMHGEAVNWDEKEANNFMLI